MAEYLGGSVIYEGVRYKFRLKFHGLAYRMRGLRSELWTIYCFDEGVKTGIQCVQHFFFDLENMKIEEFFYGYASYTISQDPLVTEKIPIRPIPEVVFPLLVEKAKEVYETWKSQRIEKNLSVDSGYD